MKALPRPSLVVFWLARMFAAYGLVLPLLRFRLYHFNSDEAAIRMSALQVFSFNLLAPALLISCLLLLQSRVARFCLGLTGSLLFIMQSYRFVRGLYILWCVPAIYHLPAFYSLFEAELFRLGVLIMNLSMIWIALYPPQSSKSSTTIPSSIIPSPNPVNHINPIQKLLLPSP